jgi:hypothetical protein
VLVYGGNVVGVVFAAVTIAVGPTFGSFESSALSTIAEPFVSHTRPLERDRRSNAPPQGSAAVEHPRARFPSGTYGVESRTR